VLSVAKDDVGRFVVDEASFDLRGLSDAQIEHHLDDFNESAGRLRQVGFGSMMRSPLWAAAPCLDDCDLGQFLTGEHSSEVSPDTRRRCQIVFDRCWDWDDATPGVDADVTIGGGGPVMALSVGFALAMAVRRWGVGCLTFPGANRHGFVEVRGAIGRAEVFFFNDPTTLVLFWRHLFAFEDVAEEGFFELAGLAFPMLVFHPDLVFRRFDGSYLGLRDRVVINLMGINDHFADACQEGKGIPANVQAALGRHRVTLSPESPQTRRSRSLMRQRELVYKGQSYRCEWHAKIEPHRNRIHFSLPSADLGGKILIGLFVDHLDTGTRKRG